jgi:hypothetical protein
MKTIAISLGLVWLLLLGACSVGDSDDPAPTATSTAETAAVATATEADEDPTTTASEAESSTAEPTATPRPAFQSPTPDPSATSGTDDASPTRTGVDPELLEEIEAIEARTAELRGLELLEDVPITVISREELRQNLIDDLYAEYTPEDAVQDVDGLWLLRLIEDRDLDLFAFQVDLLSEQVLGYYDPEVNEMFIVSDADGLSPLAEFTLSHELVHSLQDQHFDIQQVRYYNQDDNDRDTAAVALLEGDAQVAQTQYLMEMNPMDLLQLLGELEGQSSDVIDSAPPYLREGLIFPYEVGLSFVQRLYAEGGFDAVNEAYANPPLSTEQIIHPEKFIDERDDPQQIELPDLSGSLGAGWQQLETNTLGEFDLSLMLRENGASSYAEAAAGWGGGRYAYYANEGSSLIATATVWDRPEDAVEFYDAMLETLAGPLDGDIGDAGQGRYLGLRNVDGTVWFITSTDRAAVESALAGIGA